MASFKTEMTVSECASENMNVYGVYTIATKFPNVIDGLKLIHRRILVTLHDYVTKEHKTRMKEATLAGRTMEMHPHGDASISDAISRLTQPFSCLIPLVFSDSNIGTYVGDRPAAARYLDVGESEHAKALFFDDINQHMLHMIPRETEDGVEPVNLLPRIPTALVVHSMAIALGYRTDTMTIGVNDLCEVTKEFIKLRSSDVLWSKNFVPISAKYFMPDYPTACYLRNSKELLSNYRKGIYNVPIVTDGTMKIKHDRIIITTLPPEKPFDTITQAVGKHWASDKTSWEYQNFQQMEDFTDKDQCITEGAFNCIVRRGVNPFDVLGKLKSLLQFSQSWTPEPRYIDANGKMSFETPPSLISKWYNVVYDAKLGDLKQTLNRYIEKYRELMALILIVDHTDAIINIFKTSVDTKETSKRLMEMFASKGLSKQQAEFLAGLRLGQITSCGRKELLEEMSKIKEAIKELNYKFKKIPELLIESIEKFEGKFKNDFVRHCIIPRFIASACYKGNGYILIEDEKEFDEIIHDFGDPDALEFNFFPRAGEVIALGADEAIIGDVPKYLKANFVEKTSKQKYTACLCDGGGALVLDGKTPKFDKVQQVCSVGNKFTIITKNGYRQLIDVNDKVIRKSASSGPTLRDAVFVSPVEDDEVFVVHGSDAQPNYLIIERVSGANTKLKKYVLGKWKVVGVYPVTADRIFINIPKELRSRCNVRHVVAEHLDEMVPPNTKMGLLYSRGSATAATPNHFELVPWKRKSSIFALKKI